MAMAAWLSLASFFWSALMFSSPVAESKSGQQMMIPSSSAVFAQASRVPGLESKGKVPGAEMIIGQRFLGV